MYLFLSLCIWNKDELSYMPVHFVSFIGWKQLDSAVVFKPHLFSREINFSIQL